MRTVRLINTNNTLDQFMSFLLDRNRTVPLIVVGQSHMRREPIILPASIQKRYGSSVQVYYLSPFMHEHFNYSLKINLGIIPTGIRYYERKFRFTDHHTRHPMWNEVLITKLTDDVFLEQLDQRVSLAYSRNYHKTIEITEEPLVAYESPAPIERPKRPVLTVRKT